MNNKLKYIRTINLIWISFLVLLFGFVSVACDSFANSSFSSPGSRLTNIEKFVSRGNINLLTWSPDGKTIAATINFYPADANPLLWAGGKVPTPFSEILFIDVESGTTTFYKEEKAMLYATHWSPDSKKIVVVYGESFLEDEDKIGIWIFDVAKDFQPEYIGKGEDAAWNPNGDTLAIIGRWDVNNEILNMRLYNLDTKTFSEYLMSKWGSRGNPDSLFLWSPDGQEIFFDIGTWSEGTAFTKSKIYVYNFETSTTLEKLYDNLKDVSHIVISPSQKIISYILPIKDTYDYKLFFLTLENNCKWEFPRKNIYTYAWSPDSQSIIYEGNVYENDTRILYIASLKDIFGDNFEKTSECP